jgi:pyridoxal phosphate enzyme (YggS family)
MNIKNNLIKLRIDIQEYEKQFVRQPHSISLLVVTKKQSVEKIQQVINAGQFVFGENYLQEALPKIFFFSNQSLIWHFIGPIQRNKAKKIAEHFSWVQSVSDADIAERLNEWRPEHLPPLNICLQVNISEENTKSGIKPEGLLSLADYITTLPRLKLRGLMAIPAPSPSFVDQSKTFRRLHLLFEEMIRKYPDIDTLSMGMSDDLAAAIAEGSTMVRIGTKIFGPR